MTNIARNAVAMPNPLVPNIPITFTDMCIGCNICVQVCRVDVLLPNKIKHQPPVVMFPDECWYCGCCVDDCPVEGACTFDHPLSQKVAWKRKETGQIYRVGMDHNPPSCGKTPYI